MPRRKPKLYRLNLTASGTFRDHLEFLRKDTALEDNGIIRIAVADMAKQRGYKPPVHDKPAPKNVRGGN